VPVQGVSTYSEPGDWFTYELNHYALAALAWDPNADVDALIVKFCAARYGDQAAVAKETIALLEKIVHNDCSLPNEPLKSAEEIAAAEISMHGAIEELAAAKAQATDQAVRRSLERLGLMCKYAAKDLEIQHLRATGADKDQIGAKTQELHEFLKAHADEGVFLVKDQRSSIERMSKRYNGKAG